MSLLLVSVRQGDAQSLWPELPPSVVKFYREEAPVREPFCKGSESSERTGDSLAAVNAYSFLQPHCEAAAHNTAGCGLCHWHLRDKCHVPQRGRQYPAWQ